MSQYYNIVAWENCDEWNTVYEKVYSESLSNRQEALELLFIWKARCPSLPSGIESTLSLLEVQIADDANTANDLLKQQVLRLAYSSAIMRYVNHMLDTETSKGSSLYHAAKMLDVPDWIIELRHDTAHNNNLPSLGLLREATKFGLQWLKKSYWEKQKQLIANYVVGEKELDSGEERIAALMNFCLSLSICAHSQCKIKNIAQITDYDMRESILNDVREFFGEGLDTSNMNTVSVKSLINLLNGHSRRLLTCKNRSYFVNKALLGEDSLFLSLPFVDIMNERDFMKRNRLSKHFMQCFQVLLTFLHRNNLILDFILELISVTKQEETHVRVRKLAAVWVSEILKALKRSENFIQRQNRCKSDETSHKKKSEIIAQFYHWFPNEKGCRLLLDLEKPAPDPLTDINFIQPIISSYNPFLTFFIKDLLNLLRDSLPQATIEKICLLAELIYNPEKFPTNFSKIYTVEDLRRNEPSLTQEDSDSDCVEVSEDAPGDEVEAEIPCGIWKLACNKSNWSSCPIGLLPWQQNSAVESMDVD